MQTAIGAIKIIGLYTGLSYIDVTVPCHYQGILILTRSDNSKGIAAWHAISLVPNVSESTELHTIKAESWVVDRLNRCHPILIQYILSSAQINEIPELCTQEEVEILIQLFKNEPCRTYLGNVCCGLQYSPLNFKSN